MQRGSGNYILSKYAYIYEYRSNSEEISDKMGCMCATEESNIHTGFDI